MSSLYTYVAFGLAHLSMSLGYPSFYYADNSPRPCQQWSGSWNEAVFTGVWTHSKAGLPNAPQLVRCHMDASVFVPRSSCVVMIAFLFCFLDQQWNVALLGYFYITRSQMQGFRGGPGHSQGM